MRAGRVFGAILVLMFCLSGQVRAQNVWTQKPFRQWTKEEAEKVLNDPPWAKKQELRISYAGRSTAVAGAPTAAEGEGGLIRTEQNTAALGGARAPVDFVFTLRLRSALPVRQALVRLKQIEARYDQMSEKDRAKFDEKLKGLLECPACADNYVLTLSSKSKESPGADAVYSTFGGAKEADIKRYLVIINDRGERRELVHFVPPRVPGEEAVFFFPRLDDKGAPLLKPETKTLVFNVTNGEANNIVNFRIDISALVAEGAVQF
ncbi:MAG: hypothetical protein QOJ02_3364 [Acidobacteriota bacterium]|nr:hypothetical protein [Acidobacteriota bacterium]